LCFNKYGDQCEYSPIQVLAYFSLRGEVLRPCWHEYSSISPRLEHGSRQSLSILFMVRQYQQSIRSSTSHPDRCPCHRPSTWTHRTRKRLRVPSCCKLRRGLFPARLFNPNYNSSSQGAESASSQTKLRSWQIRLRDQHRFCWMVVTYYCHAFVSFPYSKLIQVLANHTSFPMYLPVDSQNMG
jgi:hypothetical protein